MTHPASTLEGILAKAYQDEADCYRRALQAAEDLPAAFDQAGCGPDKVKEVVRNLELVAGIEARLTEAKRQWRQGGQRAGPELRQVVAEVALLIERLQERVCAGEVAAEARKASLLPEIEKSIRGLRMRRAYQTVRAAQQPLDE